MLNKAFISPVRAAGLAPPRSESGPSADPDDIGGGLDERRRL